jgi:hypothetical protein
VSYLKLKNMGLESGEIEVSKKTLLHISEGIYRTEGSSIKELISNAFDARAKKVVVTTNYPNFDILTCQDDGDGMTEGEFLRIVKGGIGDSQKATLSSGNRPIIGKLGIGILAIAQVCRSFTIISHHQATKSAFKGKMIFRTDVDKVAIEKSLPDLKASSYEIGTWELEERLDYDPKKKGVLIFTKDLRQSFLKRFREDKTIINTPKNETPLDFKNLLDRFYVNDRKAINQLGPYYELIWELCQLAPLPYFNGSPIREEYLENIANYKNESLSNYTNGIDFLMAKQSEINEFDFSVIFDDIKLYRPIKLPFPTYRNDKLQESQLFYYEYDKVVRKRRLKFSFYCIAQENAISPRDLKGIQIRIKNVGIGLNDATYLKYDKIVSPRDNWISGEIYVEHGLESALNIDRDSFNENDEHYFIVKKQIHEFLGTNVFPTITALQRKRNKEKRNQKEVEYSKEMKARLVELFINNTDYTLNFTKSNESYTIDKKNRTIQFPEIILTSSVEKRRFFFSSMIVSLFPVLQEKTMDNQLLSKIITSLSEILLD